MGTVVHHAIIITGLYEGWVDRARDEALRHFIPDQVSPITPPLINGARSFCIFPDGSKEGWEQSDLGDRSRNAMVRWLRAQAYDDGSTPLAWVEVGYGELVFQSNGARVARHAWQRRPQERCEDCRGFGRDYDGAPCDACGGKGVLRPPRAATKEKWERRRRNAK